MKENKIFTRMGDGSMVYMTPEEVRADIAAGVADAVKRGKIDPLTEEEMEKIYEIVTMPGGIVGVHPTDAVVTTNDSGSDKISTKCGIPVERSVNAMIHERVLGGDSVDIGYSDYNYKTVKGVAKREAAVLKHALTKTSLPLYYGAMPNLGFYTKPDGPVDNWAILLPEGKIKEALAAQEEAVGYAVDDITFVAKQMYDAGADGIELDTCGAAGDADFLAALKAAEIISKEHPDMPVIMGMAGEFILGMHGRLEYDGVRLAGLYAHKQVALAEKAGVSIFGAVVNTNCNASFPWNIARVCTFIKATTAVANIPVHVDVGMGVGGIPMCENLPADVVTRADKCLIEIGKADGLQIGVGDPLGTEAAHALAASMGGVRTAGDMVFRLQLGKKMKINDAKKYVAEKLGVTLEELCDVVTMSELREERGFGLGHVEPDAVGNIGMEAKFRIAEALDIKINSVERFKKRAGLE